MHAEISIFTPIHNKQGNVGCLKLINTELKVQCMPSPQNVCLYVHDFLLKTALSGLSGLLMRKNCLQLLIPMFRKVKFDVQWYFFEVSEKQSFLEMIKHEIRSHLNLPVKFFTASKTPQVRNGHNLVSLTPVYRLAEHFDMVVHFHTRPRNLSYEKDNSIQAAKSTKSCDSHTIYSGKCTTPMH